MTAPEREFQVVVVGAGPTGLTLANLLGKFGVRTLLVERNETTVGEPRAVSIDDESLRVMQAIGLADKVIEKSALDYGSLYLDAAGRAFASVEPTASEYGYPRRNAFNQPELEADLRAGLERFEGVEARFHHEWMGLDQGQGLLTAVIRGAGGESYTVEALYLVACDGGKNPVREALGIEMVGETYEEPWLIIDLKGSKDPFRQTRVYCDPSRPGINLPGPDGARRFEFMLLEGETEEQMTRPDFVSRLLESCGPDKDAEIVRKQVYTFHARRAASWKAGGVFLAGDAAHLTPPFAGQGMNSGIRDAFNLAWKLAYVVKGYIGPGLLESYQQERLPHAWQLIEMAILLGRAMMPRTPFRAWAVQAGFRLLGLAPPLRDYVTEMRYKPQPRFAEGFFVPDGRPASKTLVGRMIPQPNVETPDRKTVKLDQAMGPDFCLLAYAKDPERAFGGPESEAFGGLPLNLLCVTPRHYNPVEGPIPSARDLEGGVSELFGGRDDHCLLIRPDRYAAAVIPRDGAGRVLGEIKALLAAAGIRQ